jgi:hypothetical protein
MNHRRALVALGVSGLALAAAPSIASASEAFTQTLSSGTENLGGYHISGDVPSLASLDVDVTAKASWSAPLTTVVAWDQNKVRQMRDVPVSRSVTPLALGTLKVRWTASGSVKPKGLGAVNFSGITFGDDAGCSLQTIGGNYTCTAQAGVPLVKTLGIPASPYVKLVLKATFDVTPEGLIVDRTFSLNGTPWSTAANLPLSVLPASETMKLACHPLGWDVAYRLSSPRWSPKVAVKQQPAVQIGTMDPIFGLSEAPALYDKSFGAAVHSSPTFELKGPGHTTDMGSVNLGGC